MRKFAKLGLIQTIERITGKMAPGRAPSFTEAHVIKALETIGVEKGVGRIKLSKILGLGEGEARTLVKHLKNEGLVEVYRSGIALSEFGEEMFLDLRSKIPEATEVPSSPLTVGTSNLAVLVRDVGHKVKYGVEQRDAAIKVGALGATTLVFSGSRLTVPGLDEDVFRGVRQIRDMLVSELKPKENDVIIIGSANNKLKAELGAKTAAFELLKSSEKEKPE